MGLFNYGKNLIEKHPKILKICSFTYNRTIGHNRIKLKGKNKTITGEYFMKNTKTNISGYGNTIEFGKKCFIQNCNIHIDGNNNKIILGEKVYAVNTEFWLEDSSNENSIDDKTTICGATHLAATEGKKISIGRDCMFSTDVVIRTGDSHSILNKNNGQRVNLAADVNIGNHVWLGNKTIVLKGSSILDNSIIATGTIVTKVFEQSNVIIAGNPSKVIKENIEWLRERI